MSAALLSDDGSVINATRMPADGRTVAADLLAAVDEMEGRPPSHVYEF